MDNIKNKNVLITGAAVGIGYGTAEILLKNGAKAVAILDLSTSPGKNSAATLEKQFGKNKAYFFPCDVSNYDEFEASFKKAADTLKGLDIVINNAGILDEKRWVQTININITAVMHGSNMALDYMGKNNGGKGGTLINIASVIGLYPCLALPAYTASKHAVVGFSRCIQAFYENTGVRVLVMCPGATETVLFQNTPKKATHLITAEAIEKELLNYPGQTTDQLVEGILEFIVKGKNGQIWVREAAKPCYSVDIPHFSKLGTPV